MSNSIHPTPEQTAWLKENFRLYSNEHLAEKLKVPVNRLTGWMKLLGLRKRETVRKIGVINYKKKRINPGPEKKIKRPPADHTNLSREQHVERILKMEMQMVQPKSNPPKNQPGIKAHE